MLFKTDRFGMFIHFGPYSALGWHEQHQLRLGTPKSEYVKNAMKFNPEEFSAEQTVLFAKESGAQYICFTAKHHDGFCMWNTKYTDYNIMNTPFGRDILAELSEACRRHGMKLELYYSLPDWNCRYSVNDGSEGHKLKCPNDGDEPNEDKYVEYVKNQVTELLTNYGKIHALFWDIPPARRDESVNELVRSLQPGILINDRGYDKGDYSTPEREACIKNASFERLCEACQSVGSQSWGYREEEDYFTSTALIASMSPILIKGGNYLLNVGPDGKGRIPETARGIFSRVGDWYRRIYDSIVDTKFVHIGSYDFTFKGNSLYLHLPAAFGCEGVSLSPITESPVRAVCLNGGEELFAGVVYCPSDYNGRDNTPHLHIRGIEAEKYLCENIVIRLDFEDISEVLSIVGAERPTEIL